MLEQGDELTAGERIPMTLTDLHVEQQEIYLHLMQAVNDLEAHYKDAQVSVLVKKMVIYF